MDAAADGAVVYTREPEAGGGGASRPPPPAFSLAVREGDSAPGTGGGVFDDIKDSTGRIPDELRLCLNDVGAMAFLAKLQSGAGAPGGVTTADDWVIYVRERDGTLRLVVREGQTLPVAGGGMDVVTNLDLDQNEGSLNSASGGSDGRGRCLSNAGAVAFRAVFAGADHGVYLSRPVNPVPSLAPVAMVALVLILLFAARRALLDVAGTPARDR